MTIQDVPRVPSADLEQVVLNVWALRPPPRDFFQSPQYRALAAVCVADHGGKRDSIGMSSALSNILRSLGLPAFHPDRGRWGPVEHAAARIDACFRMSERRLVHLCPFDVADTLPDLKLGAAHVRTFTLAELEAVLDAPRLRRWTVDWSIDADKLSELQWLVVEEDAAVPPEPGRRSLPFIYLPIDQWGRGRINPHASRFPKPVQEVLFIILLAAWEDWNGSFADDWRGFQIPWSHTIDPDLAVRPLPLPSIEGFAWQPDPREDDEDRERLAHYSRDASANEVEAIINLLWDLWEAGRTSELFSAPIVHFLVTAFVNKGIDEFMAHVSSIEAALGLSWDHRNSERPPSAVRPGINGTRRMIHRMTALLDDETAATEFDRLFQVRSQFVHGRAMDDVPVSDLVAARRLARRVAVAILGLAAAHPARSRVDVLEALLEAGASRTLPGG